MDTIKLYIGSIQTSSNFTQNNTHPVEFLGEQLATRREFGYSARTGGLTDTRGTTQTLYKAADGRLLVHVEDWSRWQGEPTTYSLREVTEADLGANGEFEALGREAGYGRALTLDEALND